MFHELARTPSSMLLLYLVGCQAPPPPPTSSCYLSDDVYNVLIALVQVNEYFRYTISTMFVNDDDDGDDGDNNGSKTSIDTEIESWSSMEYALRQESRIIFSKMLSEIKQYHAAFEKKAGAGLSAEALFMSLILQNQQTIDRLLRKIEELEQNKKKR
jgi:hypothetical protein